MVIMIMLKQTTALTNIVQQVLTTPVFPLSVERNKLLSYYGRFTYTLADKYILIWYHAC
jgi:hypothetical protein